MTRADRSILFAIFWLVLTVPLWEHGHWLRWLTGATVVWHLLAYIVQAWRER